MNDAATRRMQGERGASLVLAIAFMVVVGVITAAVIATTSSGIQDRVALDQARNREYAADAAIETNIATARNLSSPSCPPPASAPFALNNINIHVDCSTALVVGPGGNLLFLGDLTFVACVAQGSGGGTACTSSTGADPPIITARVNFQGSTPMSTFVEAWSVNG
jgi:hypothetical protein